MTPEQASAWRAKNSKFLKLEDGESFTAKLKDMKAITSHFDSEKEVIHYTFELPDGSVKFFDNGSGALCEQLSGLVGKTLQIFRKGEGNNTKYEAFEAE